MPAVYALVACFCLAEAQHMACYTAGHVCSFQADLNSNHSDTISDMEDAELAKVSCDSSNEEEAEDAVKPRGFGGSQLNTLPRPTCNVHLSKATQRLLQADSVRVMHFAPVQHNVVLAAHSFICQHQSGCVVSVTYWQNNGIWWRV